MARTRAFDDETVVRAARELFWERGYASTSLGQLQIVTGLSRSSLYETYGSKRGLFARACRSYLDEVVGPLLAPLEAASAGREELLAYFTGLAQFFRCTTPAITRRGCLMLNTALELNDLDAEALAMVSTYRQRVHSAFLRCVRTIGTVDDPQRRAEILTAAQIGLMLTSRIDPAPAAHLAENLAAEVRSW